MAYWASGGSGKTRRSIYRSIDPLIHWAKDVATAVGQVTVAIALGSNLGDRRAHLRWATARLADGLTSLRVSTFIETDPVDVPDAQPPYLNAVVVAETTLDPDALLELLLEIEHERGRERPSARAARTLDCDLILYGDRVVHTPRLDVPHPRFRDRQFVLEPLCEIAPDMRDPVTGMTVGELLRKAEGKRQKSEGSEK